MARLTIPIFLGLAGALLRAQTVPVTVTVTGTVSVIRDGRGSAGKSDSSGAVIWLKPVVGTAERRSLSATARGKILQQHKSFDPHVLAIPVGTVVDFPNLDPFFHNVFSMFDGKRFDLGLYEAGASHSVTFDHPGVVYIFCNIHPEMSAVIVVTDSPFFAVTGVSGEFSIPNVVPGRYLVTVWHERGKPEGAGSPPREVTISPENARLAPVQLHDSGPLLVPHKNKYGRDYDNLPNKTLPY